MKTKYTNAQPQVKGTQSPIQGQSILTQTPELNGKLHRLADEVCQLENITDALWSRLQPIIRPLPCEAGKNESLPSPPQASLSNEVEGLAGRLSYLRNRISEMMDALAI